MDHKRWLEEIKNVVWERVDFEDEMPPPWDTPCMDTLAAVMLGSRNTGNVENNMDLDLICSIKQMWGQKATNEKLSVLFHCRVGT